jgi:hypothetical protein
MDVRSYYKKVREAEATLTGEYMVMVSLATPEGGKDNVKTEVPKGIAAKLIAEGRSRVATAEEAKSFHDETQFALMQHQEEEAARRLQVMVIPSHEMRKLKDRI